MYYSLLISLALLNVATANLFSGVDLNALSINPESIQTPNQGSPGPNLNPDPTVIVQPTPSGTTDALPTVETGSVSKVIPEAKSPVVTVTIHLRELMNLLFEKDRSITLGVPVEQIDISRGDSPTAVVPLARREEIASNPQLQQIVQGNNKKKVSVQEREVLSDILNYLEHH